MEVKTNLPYCWQIVIMLIALIMLCVAASLSMNVAKTQSLAPSSTMQLTSDSSWVKGGWR